MIYFIKKRVKYAFYNNLINLIWELRYIWKKHLELPLVFYQLILQN